MIVAADVVVVGMMLEANSFVRDSAVRREQNEDVSVIRHVGRVSAEAGLAAERNAAETTEREGWTKVVVQHVSQVAELVIDLIWADRVRKQRVHCIHAETFSNRYNRLYRVVVAHGAWEVVAYHRVVFDHLKLSCLRQGVDNYVYCVVFF